MEKLVYRDDAEIMRKTVIRATVICALITLVGLLWLPNFGKVGYIGAALGGCAIGGGGVGLVLNLKMLGRSKRPMDTIIQADEKGITLSTGEGTTRTVVWEQIRAIRPATRGVQKGIAVDITDPDGYFKSLSASEKKIVRDYHSFFGSPFSVKVNYCKASQEEMSVELNRVLALHKEASVESV